MKSLIFVAAFLATIFCDSSLRADPGTTVATFQNSGFTYGYEGWKDLGTCQTLTPDGIHLVGTAAGGAGFILDKLQDITDSKFLNVKIKRADIANHSDLLIKLFDGAGKTIQWTIKASDIPTDSFKVIQLPIDAKPSADLEEIKQVQIQGTFDPSKRVDFYLASIVSA